VRDIEARAALVSMWATTNKDGSEHPHFESSKQRIPVSLGEKRWLYDYFDSNRYPRTGNYYRFDICLRVLSVYVTFLNLIFLRVFVVMLY
jgi:hypothetical protein